VSFRSRTWFRSSGNREPKYLESRLESCYKKDDQYESDIIKGVCGIQHYEGVKILQIDQVTADHSAVPRKYEYIEHTADLGFKAYGATQQELFVNAAEALFEVLVSLETIQPSEERLIRVEAPDLEGLMVAWLSELLYVFETQNLLLNRFHMESMKSDSLEATVCGEVMDPARHEIKTCVKAVTYHQLYVTRRSGIWETQVFLDL